MSLDFLLSKYLKYWWLASLMMLVIVTMLSIIPLPELPEVSNNDKVYHIIAYALVMFPIALRKPQNWLLLGFVVFLWSGAIELIQPFANRHGEWLDLLANTIGIMVGYAIGTVIEFLLKRDDVKS